jgi:hypothetical protein
MFEPNQYDFNLFNPLNLDPLWPWLLMAGGLHVLIGVVGSTIAIRKGRPRHIWLWLGPLGGTPSLLMALGLGPMDPPES